MNKITWRWVVFAGLLAVSFFPIYELSSEAIQDLTTSEASLKARFLGQAPEDIFGFGFWFTWLLFLLSESLVIVAAWFTLKQSNVRYLVYLPVGAFVVASVFNYVGYERVYEIFFK